MGSLSHRNIIDYYGCEELEESLHIFLEYMPQGSISSLLKNRGPLPTFLIRNYTIQILDALTYLHAHKCLHKDIKGGNILISANNVPKLADFGNSQQLEQTVTLSVKRKHINEKDIIFKN